jgi:hypothetical protein
MNNVDIAISKVRELQQLIYSPDSSPNSLFKYTQEIMKYMDLASKEINSNYEEISRKLTEQLNSGKIQQ